MTEDADKLPTKEEFAVHVNENFQVRLDGEVVADFILLNVKPLISNSVQESFRMSFRAPLSVPPIQNLFDIEHQSLGSMSLLLVPYKQDEDGLYFDAVFNNLV